MNRIAPALTDSIKIYLIESVSAVQSFFIEFGHTFTDNSTDSVIYVQ